MSSTSLKHLPDAVKPRERLRSKGPAGLPAAELLAILLGSGYRGRNVLGVSRRILGRYSPKVLAGLSLQELDRLKGIGPAKASMLQAAFELSRRAFAVEDGLQPTITSVQDVLDQITALRTLRKEHVVVLYLNARHQVVAQETVSVGTLTASLIHPREVFEPALAHGAASVILCHNHPSGDATPTEEDLAVTRRVRAAGEVLGIAVLDHVIVAARAHVSLKDLGHL